MDNFLRVFEAKALARALTEAGHAVSERTVQRWKAGKTKPKPQDIQAIRRVIRLPDATKEPPPEWARELADQTARRVIEALAPDDLRRALTVLRERIEETPPPGGEAPHGIDGERGGGTADPKARSDESRRDRAS